MTIRQSGQNAIINLKNAIVGLILAHNSDNNAHSNILSGYSTTSHTHGNLTSDGKVGTTASRFVVTTTGGALTTSSTYTTSKISKVGHTHVIADTTDVSTVDVLVTYTDGTSETLTLLTG